MGVPLALRCFWEDFGVSEVFLGCPGVLGWISGCPPPGPADTPPLPAGKRPRKGLATAKQRLGRILKIHRNGKLLL